MAPINITRAENSPFSIQRIIPNFVSVPEFHYSGGPNKIRWKSASRNSYFLALDVEFSYLQQIRFEETCPVDNLLFTYYVLLNTRSQKQGVLLVGTVTHRAIRTQREMASVMYVSPAILDRFFRDRILTTVSQAIHDVGVTISKEGQVVAFKSWKGHGMWWKGHEQISGFLLRKDQTPFAPLLWDYYEQIYTASLGVIF